MALNDRTGVSVRCALVGKASVEHDVVTSRTGLVSCTNGTGGSALASKGDPEGMVLSRSRSSLHWASAVRGSLLMMLLVLSPLSELVGRAQVSMMWLTALLRMLLSSSLRCAPSSVLKLFPPGSYTRLPLSLVLKLLGSRGWLRSLLMWTVLPVLSLCAGLSSLLSSGWLWLLLGTCACPDFVIGVASPSLTLEISACSFIWQLLLFCLTLVASDRSGNAAAVGEGGGGRSS